MIKIIPLMFNKKINDYNSLAIIYLYIFFCFQWCHSQIQSIDIWDGSVPNVVKSNEKETIEKGGTLRIRKVQQPTLSVFLPAKNYATGKGVLVLPGGGYGLLAYDWEGTDVAKWLNSIGIAAFVLKYRLPSVLSQKTPYEVPLQDAQQAMKIIREKASQYNIAQNKIGVIGFSAGGHLASTLSTHFTKKNSNKVRPDFSVLIYPVITMKKEFTHKGSRRKLLGDNPDSQLVHQFSNELRVTSNTPPTFMVHATNDKVVPVENSIEYYKSLKKHGVKSELHIYEKGGHGFSLAIKNNYVSTWRLLFKAWVEALE